MNKQMYDYCYSEMAPSGRLILTPQFERSLKEMYSANGWDYPEQNRGKAMDSAPEPLDERKRGRWPPPKNAPHARSTSLDAAMEDDLPPLLSNSGERNNSDLTAAYAKILNAGIIDNPEYAKLNGDWTGRVKETFGLGDSFRQTMERSPEQHEADYQEFKRIRGWDDAPDETLRRTFELQSAYDARLRGDS